MLRIIFSLIAIISLLSCAVGPDYVRPPVITPPAFKEAKGHLFTGKGGKKWKVANPRDLEIRGCWWKMFNDKRLNELEHKLELSNQNIINAYFNYNQAIDFVNQARADFFPTLAISELIARTRTVNSEGSSVTSTPDGTTSIGTVLTDSSGGTATLATGHSLLFFGSWEPDIWGLVRRSVEASSAKAEANAALLAATRLSMEASLAQFYFELRSLDRLQILLNKTVRDYKSSFRLVHNQFNAGIVPYSDVVQAQTLLQIAESSAVNNKINRAKLEHAIAVLIGEPPATFSLPSIPLNTLPPSIPIGVPSELLERRPDIAQAERVMVEANAQIGIAKAAYFPALTLTANGNVTKPGFANWFSIPDLGWTISQQFTQLILDGGARKATLSAAWNGYLASVASYRQAVLTAFQKVEDHLAALRLLSEQSTFQKKALANARLALKLVLNQYKEGTVAYSNVITAQIAVYTAEKTTTNILGQQMISAVGLIKELGGDWKTQGNKIGFS